MRTRSVSVVLLAGFLIGVAWCRASPQEAGRQEQTAPGNGTPPKKAEPPVQPIPYSHKKHLAFGLACRECHPNPEPGDRMTLPPAEKCMSCHATVAKEKPAIQKLSELAKSNQPIPWVRVYVVSSWVYWNHRSHLEAKMTCEACHGRGLRRAVRRARASRPSRPARRRQPLRQSPAQNSQSDAACVRASSFRAGRQLQWSCDDQDCAWRRNHVGAHYSLAKLGKP